MQTRHLLAALLAALSGVFGRPAPALAGGGPENVAIVVNADSWASIAVANEYVRLRNVPPGNMIYLRHVPSFETIDVDMFRQKILAPVLRVLELRGLGPQIDYLVYSSDLPYAVDVRNDVGDKKFHKVITPTASINGLTYLYPLVLTKNAGYLTLGSNFYMRQLVRPVERIEWTKDQATQYAGAVKSMTDGKWADALPTLLQLQKAHPKANTLLYNLACCLAKLDRPNEAMGYLEQAVKTGWLDVEHTLRDEDLESLRDRDDFRALANQMAEEVFLVQPSRGFRGLYGWTRQGQMVQPNQGVRYLLSTMLAVTSGRGTSVSEAIGYLGRSAAADATHPEGTIYFMTNSDIRSTTRRWAFKSAVKELEALGVKARIVEGTIPSKAPDVMGAVVGTATFNWAGSQSTILPGAICEHLTSLGGVMHERGGQTPLSEFLRAGAAGASGTVTEPYAVQAKFPTPFIQVHYARGCSLAEAFYQSIAGPYQLLIVGDPLCAPWAKPPQVKVEGVEPGQTVSGKVTLKPSVLDTEATPVRRFELYLNGRRVGACGPEGKFDLDTTGLADGYHELRVVGLAADVIEAQGRVVLPLVVQNHGRSVSFSAQNDEVALDGSVTVEASMPGASGIVILHNGRQLAGFEGDHGKLTIPAEHLGLGVAHLTAMAVVNGPREKANGDHAGGDAGPAKDELKPAEQTPDKSEAKDAPDAPAVDEPKVNGADKARLFTTSVPVTVTVNRPAAMPALPGIVFDSLIPGLRAGPKEGATTVVTDTRNDNWVAAQAGVAKSQAFTIDAYFQAPMDDLYQFQVNTNAKLSLDVDGQTVAQIESERWRYVPVALKVGVHRLRVTGEASDPPRLDIRFGGSGTETLDGQRFRHAGP